MNALQFTNNTRVWELKSFFKENFGATLRVYKNVSCKGQFADDNATLFSLIPDDAPGGTVAPTLEMSVGEYEDLCKKRWGIGVQIANTKNTELLDNNLTFADLIQKTSGSNQKDYATNKSKPESAPQRTTPQPAPKPAAPKTPIDPDEEYYNAYIDARIALYNQAKEQIMANRNISPAKFCEWYKVAEYWQGGPRLASGLQKKAEILKKYVKSPSICAKMDGMIDLSKLFHPEYERLIQLVLKNEAYWSHPDIRSHYPGMCATGEKVAEEIRIEKAEAKKKAQEKADNLQPWYLLLSLICAIVCIVLICVEQEYCLLITIIVCGGLIYLFKKLNLKNCSDWNPVRIWNRYVQFWNEKCQPIINKFKKNKK